MFYSSYKGLEVLGVRAFAGGEFIAPLREFSTSRRHIYPCRSFFVPARQHYQKLGHKLSVREFYFSPDEPFTLQIMRSPEITNGSSSRPYVGSKQYAGNGRSFNFLRADKSF